MGCCCSKGEDAVAVAERTELAGLWWKLERRLVSEGSPHSTGLDEAPHAFENPPEIRQVVLKDPKTTILIIDYLNNNIFAYLDFLAKLKQSLEKGRRCQENLLTILRCFDKENNTMKNNKKKKKKKHSQTLGKIKASTTTENLFDDMDTEELRAVHNQQKLLEVTLISRKREIKKKLSSSKKWRKVWKATYTIAFMGVLTCSVVLAALTAPLAAITAASVSSTAMKTIEPFFDNLWNQQKLDLESEKEVFKAMCQRASAAVYEMESIRSLVQKLKIDVGSVIQYLEFVVGEEEGMAVAMDFVAVEIMRKMEDVQKGMDKLQEKVEWFKGQAQKAATEFLKVISQDM